MTTNEQIIIDGMDVSRCEFSTIRGNELKCFAEDKDIHTCLKITEKTKCPIYRLKIQLQRKTAECEELQKLCQNQAKTINDLTGCVGLWEEFSEEESELAKNSSIADLVVLLREARSSLESKTAECEDLKERLAVANFEIESLQESQEPFKQHLDKLERKLQIATEALKFYAAGCPDGSINTAQRALEQIESEVNDGIES